MSPVGLLLAAGTSRRFGAANKLLAPLRGRPLVLHAAAALQGAGFAPLIAVVSDEEVAGLLDGFHVVRLPEGDAAQSRSLAAGVAEAEARGARALVVALGDMPGVRADLLASVAGRCGPGGISAASDGVRAMPPACFDRAHFAALRALTGDRGAAALLRTLPREALVPAAGPMLVDVDTPSDLARLRAADADHERNS